MHPLILFDANEPGEFARAEELGGKILELCVEVGGSISGEHGIGREKINQMCAQFNSDANCDIPSILRQVGLLFYNAFVFVVSPVVTLQPMEPQLCKIYLAFTNSIVVSFARAESAVRE